MEIQEKQIEHGVILSISGRLDANHTKPVEEKFLQLVEAGQKQFVFDLSSLEYISSAGLRVLLLAAKKTKAISGRLVLASLTEPVLEVFDMSGFTTIFTQYRTIEEATAALQES